MTPSNILVVEGQFLSLRREDDGQIVVRKKASPENSATDSFNILEAAEMLRLLPGLLPPTNAMQLLTLPSSPAGIWPDRNSGGVRQVIRSYFAGIQWDGQDHISRLAQYYKDDHASVYKETTGETGGEYASGVFHLYLRYWLMGAVAKIWDNHPNYLLVLHGQQCLGKSYFVRWLGNVLPAYFAQSPISLQGRDKYIDLTTRFIWEVSEIEPGKKKACDQEFQATTLEELITSVLIRLRLPYEREPQMYPATASLVMTQNGAGFPVSRSMLICRLTEVDWHYATEINPHQVWAQAVAAYGQLRQTASAHQLAPLLGLQQKINQEYER